MDKMDCVELHDADRESSTFNIEGVGLPDDQTLCGVESLIRVWEKGDDTGVVELVFVDGALHIAIEMYPHDAKILAGFLERHANRAKDLETTKERG